MYLQKKGSTSRYSTSQYTIHESIKLIQYKPTWMNALIHLDIILHSHGDKSNNFTAITINGGSISDTIP